MDQTEDIIEYPRNFDAKIKAKKGKFKVNISDKACDVFGFKTGDIISRPGEGELIERKSLIIGVTNINSFEKLK